MSTRKPVWRPDPRYLEAITERVIEASPYGGLAAVDSQGFAYAGGQRQCGCWARALHLSVRTGPEVAKPMGSPVTRDKPARQRGRRETTCQRRRRLDDGVGTPHRNPTDRR